MTFDYELTLIKKVGYTENDIGDSIPNKVNQVILCDIKSVTRNELYAAAANGLKPEIVFIINKHEYNGESEVEFESRRYSVLRTFTPKKTNSFSDFENLELVCQGVVGGVV